MNDIIGAKFLIDGDIAPSFIQKLQQIEKQIKQIGISASEVTKLIGMPATQTKKTTQNTTQTPLTNTQKNLLDSAQYYTKLNKGFDLIEKYQTKLNQYHAKEIQLRNEINGDFKIMARETGKILRQIQSVSLGGIGNKGGMMTGMQATQIVNEKLQQSRLQVGNVQNAMLVPNESERRKEETHQANLHTKAEKERRAQELHQDKLQRREEANAKKMAKMQKGRAGLHGDFINEASFGGIYLTGLATSYALAPYRSFRDYEKEMIIAAKNIDNKDIKIDTVEDARKYGKERILSMYADKSSAVSQFGILSTELAKIRGEFVQSGFKEGGANSKERAELDKAVNEYVKLTSVLEVDPKTAMKFISYSPKYFEKELLAFKEKNPGQTNTDFVSYISAMVNDLAKTNPHQAKALIEAIVAGGSGASVGGLPAYMYMNFLSQGLSAGVSPRVIATISSRMFSGFGAAMKKKKIWIDPESEKEMMKISEGTGDYLGMKNEAGAFYYTLEGVLKGILSGKVDRTEAKLLAKTMAQGAHGQQNVIGGKIILDALIDKETGKDRTLEQYREYVKGIQRLNLANIDIANLEKSSPKLAKMLKSASQEAEIVTKTIEAYENRAKAGIEVLKLATGETFLPVSKTFLSGVESLTTNLAGALESPTVKAAVLTLGAAVLTGIVIQLGKIVVRAGSGIFGNLKDVKPFLFNVLGRTALFGAGNSTGLTGKIGKFFSQQSLFLEGMLLNRFAPLKDTTLLSDVPKSWQRRHAWNRYRTPVLNSLGAGATALALYNADDIMGFIDTITTSASNQGKKFSESDLGKGIGGGLGAINPMEAKNMVAYYLLMSGNKAMATGAAIYLSNQFFSGYFEKMGITKGMTEEEKITETMKRSMAIGVAIHGWSLGPVGIAAAWAALTYLGVSFIAPMIDTRDVGEITDSRILSKVKSEMDAGRLKKEDVPEYVKTLRQKMDSRSLLGEKNSVVRNIDDLDLETKYGIQKNKNIRDETFNAIALPKTKSEQTPLNVNISPIKNADGTIDMKIESNGSEQFMKDLFGKSNKKTNFSTQEMPVYQTV